MSTNTFLKYNNKLSSNLKKKLTSLATPTFRVSKIYFCINSSVNFFNCFPCTKLHKIKKRKPYYKILNPIKTSNQDSTFYNTNFTYNQNINIQLNNFLRSYKFKQLINNYNALRLTSLATPRINSFKSKLSTGQPVGCALKKTKLYTNSKQSLETNSIIDKDKILKEEKNFNKLTCAKSDLAHRNEDLKNKSLSSSSLLFSQNFANDYATVAEPPPSANYVSYKYALASNFDIYIAKSKKNQISNSFLKKSYFLKKKIVSKYDQKSPKTYPFLQKSRTYYFLQTILVYFTNSKYYHQSSTNFSYSQSLVSQNFFKFSGNIDSRLTKLATPNPFVNSFVFASKKLGEGVLNLENGSWTKSIKSSFNLFLFNQASSPTVLPILNKINNKSFLGYWLIPVAGLALITPKIFYISNNNLDQKNSLWLTNQKIQASLPILKNNFVGYPKPEGDFLSVKFNNENNKYNLYNFIKYLTNLLHNKKMFHLFFGLNFSKPYFVGLRLPPTSVVERFILWQSQRSWPQGDFIKMNKFFPNSLEEARRGYQLYKYGHRPTDVCFQLWQSQTLPLKYKNVNKFQVCKHQVAKINITENFTFLESENSFSTKNFYIPQTIYNKQLHWLQTNIKSTNFNQQLQINPLASKIFLNNNSNFISTQSILKIIKLKISNNYKRQLANPFGLPLTILAGQSRQAFTWPKASLINQQNLQFALAIGEGNSYIGKSKKNQKSGDVESFATNQSQFNFLNFNKIFSVKLDYTSKKNLKLTSNKNNIRLNYFLINDHSTNKILKLPTTLKKKPTSFIFICPTGSINSFNMHLPLKSKNLNKYQVSKHQKMMASQRLTALVQNLKIRYSNNSSKMILTRETISRKKEQVGKNLKLIKTNINLGELKKINLASLQNFKNPNYVSFAKQSQENFKNTNYVVERFILWRSQRSWPQGDFIKIPEGVQKLLAEFDQTKAEGDIYIAKSICKSRLSTNYVKQFKYPKLIRFILPNLEKNKIKNSEKNGVKLYFNYLNKSLKKFIILNKEKYNKTKNKIKCLTAMKAELIYLDKINNEVSHKALALNKYKVHHLGHVCKHQKINNFLEYKQDFWQTNFNQQLRSNVSFALRNQLKKINLASQKQNSASLLLKYQKMFKNQLIKKADLQKKRKAKKQRLETRRQKKRTRFFPRPMWLRYRMFLNFIKQRQGNFSFLVNQNNFYTQLNSHSKINNFLSNRLKSKVKKSILNKIYRFQHTIFNKQLLKNKDKAKLKQNHRKTLNPLHDLKVFANYINFKNQKTTNPPPPIEKEQDKDTILRDFWIWTYNNTLLKNYGTPNIINYNVYWALNKTNINIIYKRSNLWSTQKLRNQSKNNKTKFLEKQFIDIYSRFFLNKNLNLFYKKITNKSYQKTQKLNYLTNYKSQKNIFKTKNLNMFNISWWSNLKSFVTINAIFNKDNLMVNYVDGLYTTLQVTKTRLTTMLTSPWQANHRSLTDGHLLKSKNVNNFLLISSSIFLHLCALISLISISQVRCFLKFHLILFYKFILASPKPKALIYQISNKINKISKTYKSKGNLSKVQLLAKLPLTLGLAKNRPSNLTKTPNRLLTYFSLNLFKKEFNKLRFSDDIYIAESKLEKKANLVLNKYFPSRALHLSKTIYSKDNILSYLKKKPTSFEISKLPKGNFDNELHKNLAKLENTKQKNKNILIFKNQTLVINQLRSKLNIKKITNRIFKSSKNLGVFVFTNTIDLFQTNIRAVSNFFEKPAEYTTSWIAYGFLVEWSSDLITIIPENIDKKTFLSFSKISRIVPITYLFSHFSHLKLFSFITNFPILLTISHLLHRRILYLFDTLIEIISRPDTDLINRQEKGTLFWDIWADFLVTAADYYNVNVAALSTIKAEQNSLIWSISNDFDQTIFNQQQGKNTFSKKIGKLAKQKGNHLDRKINLASQPILINNYFGYANPFGFLDKFPNYIQKNFFKTNFKKTKKYVFDVNQELNRWSVNQYITYQSILSNSSNGDLFIDYHPPKSFSHIPAIKSNSILQQPIGNLVCQIYSGLFNKHISKNILLVNTKTILKQNLTDTNILLIQALAGETELKIITDNAHRYALINRGFAIGIKLLRDVFDAIALNTPCIFLLEDIHAIGERRPMLISDYGGAMSDDNGSFKEDFFGSQRDEVHEKNQVVYQLTRHAITHYRKPFKGDYSLAIPTNLFITDLFLKLPGNHNSNLSIVENHNVTIKNKIKNITFTNNSNFSFGTKAKKSILKYGQIKLHKNFAPPTTSPFSVLLLKEEKKLKPNKIVEELPWTGLPSEQLSTKPRTSYSIRSKVAVLAELSLSNLSAKLDMITDLLVIIDSVRSNKGFVVFATTNIPHVLDPALRRPGRLDETICLPNTYNSTMSEFNTNYEILKSVKPLKKVQLTVNLKDFNGILKAALKQSIFNIQQRTITKYSENSNLNYALISKTFNLFAKQIKTKSNMEKLILKNYNLNIKFKDSALLNRTHMREALSEDKVSARLERFIYLTYYEVGKALINFYLTNRPSLSQNGSNQLTLASPRINTFKKQTKLIHLDKSTNNFLVEHNIKSINYLSLYGSKDKLLSQLMILFGGKITLDLISSKQTNKRNRSNSSNLNEVSRKAMEYCTRVLNHGKKNIPTSDFIEDIYIFEGEERSDNLKIASSLMYAFIYKRYLYRKNLIIPKLLSFTDGNVLEEPPCPPFSSLLIPAKRFENYKRVFHDLLVGDKMGQRKAQISFVEKLQAHTQFRSIRLLNKFNKNKIDTTSGLAKSTSNHDTFLQTIFDKQLQSSASNFSSPYGYVPSTTNINWYYQNRILKRHSQYLTNQWWNGQLSEHNPETVFLSDIDWRSSFIKNNISNSSKNLYTKLKQKKVVKTNLDVLLDFPDTDQYYNPRRRRWLLNKGYWSFWFNFDKIYSEKIILTWIFESIIQTYTYLHNNVELLDFVTNKYIFLGSSNTDTASFYKTEFNTIKEIVLGNSFKRF